MVTPSSYELAAFNRPPGGFLFVCFLINHHICTFFFFFSFFKICEVLIKLGLFVTGWIGDFRSQKKVDFAFMCCVALWGCRGRHEEERSYDLIEKTKSRQHWSQNIYFTSHKNVIKGWGKEFRFKTEEDKVSLTGSSCQTPTTNTHTYFYLCEDSH